MNDTTVQDCNCCEIEGDCINGLCQSCSDYNYKLQKQSDLLTLGILQEKDKIRKKLVDIVFSDIEIRLIVQALKIWAGDFPDSKCIPSTVWIKELRKLIEKLKSFPKIGAEMADAFDKIIERK